VKGVDREGSDGKEWEENKGRDADGRGALFASPTSKANTPYSTASASVALPMINAITSSSTRNTVHLEYSLQRRYAAAFRRDLKTTVKGRNPHRQTSWKVVGNPGCELVAWVAAFIMAYHQHARS